MDEFISSLKFGFETLIGENGQQISGGQIQRILLARSLYQNKSILILDEATSALDDTTEMHIIKNILSLNKTILVVTHKKKLLKLFDYAYRIDDNRTIRLVK